MAVSKKTSIEYFLSLDSSKFSRSLSVARKKLSFTAKKISRDWKPVSGIFTKTAKSITFAATAAGTAATVGGFYALQSVLRTSVTDALALDAAMYSMGASLEAANRQFDVGNAEDWEQALRSMRAELKIFSETDLRNASARTVDMTKRLGLSKDQMLEVMRVSANMGAGKFALVDSVERVTAALRGEAEASEALGLTLNETYVKAWHEANNETGKAWKDLTDLEKAQVRYNVLLEQASASAGRAAESYNVMSGVTSAIASSYNELKTSIGSVITQNTFFVEGGKVINEMLQGWKKNIDDNKQQWMVWSKQSVLAVLEFSADFATGIGSAYKAMQKITGILNLSWGGAVKLGQGFQFLFEQSNKIFGDDEKAAYWAEAQKDSAAIVEKAMGAAAEAFEKSENGLDIAETAAEKIRMLKEQLADIEATPIRETAKETGKLEQKVVKVGDTWQNVWQEAEKESSAFFQQAMADLARLQAEAAKGITVTMRTVQARAAGGMIQRFASGGRLAGYGGGDRIPALLEAGEYIIRKEAVSRFGAGIFHALNNLRLPALPALPGFATGGPVGAGSGNSSSGGPGPSAVPFDLTMIPGQKPRTLWSRRQDALETARQFELMVAGASS